MSTVGLQTFAITLERAMDAVSVAATACDFNREIGIFQTAITLWDADGRPLLVVDDMRDVTDEFRLDYVTKRWTKFVPDHQRLHASHLPINDRHLVEARERAAEDGYTGANLAMYLLPLLEPGGVIGTMMVGTEDGYSDELRRAVHGVSRQVSVRLAQLGIRHRPESHAPLTPRQLEVARLAARGRTNAGIADELDMSENTVKKHLKDVFQRLAITTRAELVELFLDAAPLDHVPIGVTHRGHIVITRGA